MMPVGVNGSRLSKRERGVPRGVYRLMSLTGATLSEAVHCWNDAKGEFYLAVQIFEERHDAHESILEPPESHRQEAESSRTREESSNFLTCLLDPGVHFLKGVLAAAVVFVALEVL